jgi:pimeloyl-ACP methyl ester carboxylesterase
MPQKQPDPALFTAYNICCARYPLRRIRLAEQLWPYIDAGTGDPPLLMLPGGFADATTSWRYVDALAPHTRVISLHYPLQATRIADLADGLAHFLDRLAIKRTHVLGGSASGFVAQALVRRHPQRVATLILAQTGIPRPTRALLSRSVIKLFEHLPSAFIFGVLRLAIQASLDQRAAGSYFWRHHFVQVLANQRRCDLINRFQLAADFDGNWQLHPADLDGWNGRVVLIESTEDGWISSGERAALQQIYPNAGRFILTGRHNDSVLQPDAQINAISTALGLTAPYA